jgi:hypothetical protein
MRKLLLTALLAVGCAPANYYYSFDLTDPGAQNLNKPGQRDTLEDADIKAEMLVDPTTFQAVALDVTNKTNQTVQVQWSQIVIVAPDGSQVALHPDTQLGWVEPGLKVAARLVPFVLPASGPEAAAYDNAKFELDVPMVIRGTPKLYQFHMIVHMQKL